MKRHLGSLVIGIVLVLIYSGVAFWGVSDARAQANDSSFAKEIQGTWLLVSCVNEKEGQKTTPYGPNPRGMMVLTPGGHFSYIIMVASIPNFASNSRTKGTPEENQAVVQGLHSVFGTYRIINAKEGKLSMHIDGSSFPNWDGKELPRVFSVKGDELNVINPTVSGGGTNYILWKRTK